MPFQRSEQAPTQAVEGVDFQRQLGRGLLPHNALGGPRLRERSFPSPVPEDARCQQPPSLGFEQRRKRVGQSGARHRRARDVIRMSYIAAKACQHQLSPPPELVTDAEGVSYLLFECLLCGCEIGLKLGPDGDVEDEFIIPTTRRYA